MSQQPKLLSYANTAPVQPPQLEVLTDTAIDHIEHGNPSLAIKALARAFFEPNQWFWSQKRQREVLRSVWESITELYTEYLFQTAGDLLFEVYDAKDLEYKVRAQNKSKYNRRIRTIHRLAGELVGLRIEELDDEFKQATDFGSCRTLVELMCSGELSITEAKLSMISAHLR